MPSPPLSPSRRRPRPVLALGPNLLELSARKTDDRHVKEEKRRRRFATPVNKLDEQQQLELIARRSLEEAELQAGDLMSLGRRRAIQLRRGRGLDSVITPLVANLSSSDIPIFISYAHVA